MFKQQLNEEINDRDIGFHSYQSSCPFSLSVISCTFLSIPKKLMNIGHLMDFSKNTRKWQLSKTNGLFPITDVLRAERVRQQSC